ncbi:hypothetical protein FSP39_000183 [Pinctada imbricata]|uniref:C2H2-type domain-containing protein n=1 Tax=Pinctada imbricata TaxID=66713 RepID=A0AA88YVB1_PINIB|nr:hypothetical protein FSP39_000183 [Pinctada imbricata]
MAEDGFLTSLLERASEGDEDALQTLSDIKRKLDSVKLSQTVKNTSLNITSSKKEEAIEKHKEATKIKKVSSPEKGTQNTKLECDQCGKSFSSRRLLLRHFRSHVSKKPICELCGSEFTRMDNLKRHRKRVHMDRVEEDLPAKKKCKKTSTVTSSSLQTPENSSNIDPIDVSSHTNSTNMEQSKNEFEQDFFKLMNNSVFGKTMENVRNRVDIKLAHTEKKLKKFVSKPSFRRFQIFNQDLVGIENMKTKLVLDKPIYVGQAILDLSKCIMYDFHYNYVKKKYDQKAKLLFTDTDSLCYEIHTNDIYEDIFKDKQLFDLSNYPPNDKHFDSTNKKVPGVFKDETGKVPIKSFVGLRSKMYSFTYAEKEKQVAKGIARATIKNDLRHHMYEDCLFNETIQICQMKSIRSENHTMQVKHINKLGLTAFDDKRYVLNNGCDTLAFGHYMTEYLNNEVDF